MRRFAVTWTSTTRAQSTAQAGLLTLEAVRDMAGSLQSVQTVQLNSSFLHCTALLETRSGRAQGIVVSGQLASGGTAQQVLRMTGGPFPAGKW